MPNEVDVELFRSLSLYNIYLMQLHGSGLLERLKILLSLYKSHSIPLSTTYYQGYYSTPLLLCERLLQQNIARRCNVTPESHPCNISQTFWKYFLASEKANIQSVSSSFSNMWNLDWTGKFILIITQNDLPNRRPTPTINQSRTRDSLWNRKGRSQRGGLFERVLDMKTVLLCFVPACGSF